MRRALAWCLTAALALGVSPLRLHIPGEGWLRPLPPQGALDYSRFDGGLAPLREGFIREALGDVILAGGVPAARPGRGVAGARVRPLVIEHALNNDHLDEAQPIERVPFTAKADSTGATRSAEDPTDCSEAGVTTWYRYASPRALALQADTIGTRRATVLAVFRRTPAGLEVVGCDVGIGGNAALRFDAAAGSVYLFQVGSNTGGPLTFNLTPQGHTIVYPDPEGRTPYNYVSPSMSSDGRFLAFESNDPRLGVPDVPCLTNVPGRKSPSGPTTGSVYYRGLYPWISVGGRQPCLQVFVMELATGVVEMASRGVDGSPANAHVLEYMLSADGATVAFNTFADNLVPGDTNELSDVFVRDLGRGSIERASVTSSGEQLARGTEDVRATGDAASPSVSADGRFVFFESAARNLAPSAYRDAATLQDQRVQVYVRDRRKRTTKPVSLSSGGEPAAYAPDRSLPLARPTGSQEWDDRQSRINTRAAFPCISANGRFIAFRSFAVNFSGFEWNGHPQVYVRDLHSGTTEIVSLSRAGRPATDDQVWPGRWPQQGPSANKPCLSDDGRFVLLLTAAGDFAAGDEPASRDVFVRDRWARSIVRVSETPPSSDGLGYLRDAGRLTGSQGDDPVCDAIPEGWEPARSTLCFRAGSDDAAISADGSTVVFASYDTITEDDDNVCVDVFSYDIATGAVLRISVGAQVSRLEALRDPSGARLDEFRDPPCSYSPAVSSAGGLISYVIDTGIATQTGSIVTAGSGQLLGIYRRHATS